MGDEIKKTERINDSGETEEPKNLVVGVGASAGGLEVLQQFFNAMPRISGCAFVVVQHLSPDHRSMLPEILGKQTKMPVIQARNEMKVLPNHVYLIPPRNNMVLREGHLYLNEYDTTQVNHPIDIFFDSLANEMRERGVAVVLSGTGSDGTRGIKAVKEAGGLVIVQDPTTAKFDGMPRSAIGTGLADFVLAPRQIVEEILNFSQHPAVLIANDNVELYDDDDAMLRIYGTLKQVCGVDFTHYKRSTVVRRIERRMVITHSSTLSDFASLLEIDEREARALGREILIGVTRFFREDGEDLDKLYSTFLERFLPPSVVIDEGNQAVHFFGDYSKYLSISPGKASFSIFNLVHEDLSLAASTAISRCRSDEQTVAYTDIAVRTNDGVQHVDMTVQPLWEYSPQLMGMIALVFSDHTGREIEEGESERYDIEKTAARRIAYLENELQNTQNELKASISDLETVNEELQAANEELYTVNAEYEQKLDELTDTTNDLTNFLSSTMIGILFLDNNLNIRKFTEYVGREFNIMSHDVGRSIQIVAHLFKDIDIVEDAEAVLRSLMPIDKEVTTVDGKNYTLRIAPYRTTENSIEGLVLTIIDSIGEK